MQAADKNVLYPAATVFVNVTNSYDVKDVAPEMIELAKFAKQHVPEKHEMVRNVKTGKVCQNTSS